MLRAECDFLRTERDAALRKLEKTQVHSLKFSMVSEQSMLTTFLVGCQERKKIDGSDIIQKKMGKLKVRSREAADEGGGHHNVREIRDIELSSSPLPKHKKEINVGPLYTTCPFLLQFFLVFYFLFFWKNRLRC